MTSISNELRPGGYFKMTGQGNVGPIYGKCIRIDGNMILAEVFSKFARMGDSARLTINQIDNVISREDFEKGLTSLGISL